MDNDSSQVENAWHLTSSQENRLLVLDPSTVPSEFVERYGPDKSDAANESSEQVASDASQETLTADPAAQGIVVANEIVTAELGELSLGVKEDSQLKLSGAISKKIRKLTAGGMSYNEARFKCLRRAEEAAEKEGACTSAKKQNTTATVGNGKKRNHSANLNAPQRESNRVKVNDSKAHTHKPPRRTYCQVTKGVMVFIVLDNFPR